MSYRKSNAGDRQRKGSIGDLLFGERKASGEEIYDLDEDNTEKKSMDDSEDEEIKNVIKKKLFVQENEKKKPSKDLAILNVISVDDNSVIQNVLRSRLMQLRSIRRYWDRGDINGAIRCCLLCDQQSVLVDFLCLLYKFSKSRRTRIITSEDCLLLIDPILILLRSNFEDYIMAAVKGLEIILDTISPAIKAGGSWAEEINGIWKDNASALEHYRLQPAPLGLRAQRALDLYLSLA